jgi:hypothetical protein
MRLRRVECEDIRIEERAAFGRTRHEISAQPRHN